jgi:hypothetical protein
MMRTGKARQSGHAADERRFRSLDKTGNVRVLSPQDNDLPADVPAPSAGPEPTGKHAAPRRRRATRSAQAAQPDPPIPGYDRLSPTALRSILRILDRDQLQVLLDYERAYAGREEVIVMLERRIAKLRMAGSDAS